MIRLVSLLLLTVFLAACSSNPESRPWLTYRMDIRQGNLVTQDMVSQLKVGQTRDQVRFILGTPLVADMFHADRWDYVYRFQPGSSDGVREQRHMYVLFDKNKLSSVGGDITALAQLPVSSDKPATRVIDIAPAGKNSR